MSRWLSGLACGDLGVFLAVTEAEEPPDPCGEEVLLIRIGTVSADYEHVLSRCGDCVGIELFVGFESVRHEHSVPIGYRNGVYNDHILRHVIGRKDTVGVCNHRNVLII